MSTAPDISRYVIDPTQIQVHHRADQGEINLLIAILDDARLIATRPRLKKKHGDRERDDAIRWIQSDRNDYIFDFVGLCEILDLSPEYVRQLIGPLDQPQEQPAKRARRTKNAITPIYPLPRKPGYYTKPRPSRRCEHYGIDRSRNGRCARIVKIVCASGGWKCQCCPTCACKPREVTK